MKIALGCDHAGYLLKPLILDYLKKQRVNVLDMGTHSEHSVDYPDFAVKVATAVSRGEADFGILICGTGLGMAISANKIPGTRAVTVTEPFSASMARKHNNANIVTFGSRVIGPDMALMILDVFLNTVFDEGRHCGRVEKIRMIDSGENAGDRSND